MRVRQKFLASGGSGRYRRAGYALVGWLSETDKPIIGDNVMAPEIISGIITAVATIIAALISGWVAYRIKKLDISGKKNEPEQSKSGVAIIWFIVGSIIGGLITYFLVSYFIIRTLPNEREISLTQFVPEKAVVGYEKFYIGEFVDHQGKEYNNCFWAHAPSEIAFDLNGKFSTLDVKALYHDYGNCDPFCDDGAQFVIFLDGKEIYRSETMFIESKPIDISVSVLNGHKLVFITDDGAVDDRCCDWTIWCNPTVK